MQDLAVKDLAVRLLTHIRGSPLAIHVAEIVILRMSLTTEYNRASHIVPHFVFWSEQVFMDLHTVEQTGLFDEG